MPRFVVHYHIMPPTSYRPDHWDLMLENRTSETFNPEERTLLTWALESQLFVGRTVKAKQLDNHRAWFLDNDGELSDGRGFVTRQLSGEFEWLANGNDVKRIKLITANGEWDVRICRVADEEFELEVAEFTDGEAAERKR